jgi:hypothetical protein
MVFRYNFYNRGFERKSYRDKYKRNYRFNFNFTKLCNESDCEKKFNNKYLLRRHMKSVSLIIYFFRR